MPLSQRLLATLCALVLVVLAFPTIAAPIEPTRDDEVIDVLPGQTRDRAQQRRERELLAKRPDDPRVALGAATLLLKQARELGDPRFAGQALAVLVPWPDAATMPIDLLLMKATLLQYLHEFDASVALLQLAIKRDPQQPQAWITLATVKRVQGRYAESDDACKMLTTLHAPLFGQACLAENNALRGQWDASRTALQALIAAPSTDESQRAWLLTTLAELEQRAGRPGPSEAAWKKVLALGPDSYAALGYADLLIEQHRPAEALTVLKDEVRTDPVVLRLAIAGTLAKGPSAAADVADMRERIALANMRPEARLYHGREQAMFELNVEGQRQKAFDLAKLNATNQREALDILVLATTARALGDEGALNEARRVRAEMGLKDRRVDALL